MRIHFEISKRKHKKYKATFYENDVALKSIHFGDSRYEHFYDRTPLKAFEHLNHYDDKRRELYYKRHNRDFGVMSADYLSKKFLW